MKKIIFNALCVIGLILWALCFYIGFAYYRPDAVMTTIIAAVFVFLLMGGLVYVMKRFGDPASLTGDINHNVARNTERLAWVLYAIISLVSAVFILHFVNIDLNHKDKILNDANNQVEEMNRIFADPNKKVPDSYGAWVDQRVKAHIENIQNKGTKKTEASKLEEQLIPANCKLLLGKHGKADILCGFSRGVIQNTWYWWFGGANQMQQLETMKPKYEAELMEYSKAAKGAVYDMKAVHHEPLTKELTRLSSDDITFMGILLALILQALILLSYIVFRPKHRNGPVRTKAEGVSTYDPKLARQIHGNQTVNPGTSGYSTMPPQQPEPQAPSTPFAGDDNIQPPMN